MAKAASVASARPRRVHYPMILGHRAGAVSFGYATGIGGAAPLVRGVRGVWIRWLR
jgi:hypothetical protein